MRVRSLLRVGAAVGDAALTLGAVAPASHAERTEVSFFETIWGVGYDNIVTGVDPDDPLVLLADVTADEWCDEENGTTATVRARTKGDARVETLVDRGPLYVYDAGGLPVFESQKSTATPILCRWPSARARSGSGSSADAAAAPPHAAAHVRHHHAGRWR